MSATPGGPPGGPKATAPTESEEDKKKRLEKEKEDADKKKKEEEKGKTDDKKEPPKKEDKPGGPGPGPKDKKEPPKPPSKPLHEDHFGTVLILGLFILMFIVGGVIAGWKHFGIHYGLETLKGICYSLTLGILAMMCTAFVRRMVMEKKDNDHIFNAFAYAFGLSMMIFIILIVDAYLEHNFRFLNGYKGFFFIRFVPWLYAGALLSGLLYTLYKEVKGKTHHIGELFGTWKGYVGAAVLIGCIIGGYFLWSYVSSLPPVDESDNLVTQTTDTTKVDTAKAAATIPPQSAPQQAAKPDSVYVKVTLNIPPVTFKQAPQSAEPFHMKRIDGQEYRHTGPSGLMGKMGETDKMDKEMDEAMK